MEKISSPEWKVGRNSMYLALELLSFVAIFMLAFIPICIYSKRDIVINAWGAIKLVNADTHNLRFFFFVELAALLVIVLFLVLAIVFIVNTIVNLSNEEKTAKYVKTVIILSSVVIAIYTFFTFVFSPINCMLGGTTISKVSYAPLIMIAIIDVIYALTVETLNAYRASKEFENNIATKKYEDLRKKERRKLYFQHLEASGNM